MNNSCVDEFLKGRQERARCPLPSGVYKLEGARRGLIESLALMKDIRDTYPRPVRGARGRLKSLPKKVAHELGWNVVPAVEALAGDGMPNTVVESLAIYARDEADALVMRLGKLDDDLSGHGVDVELVHLKFDRSRLEELLTDAVRLIDYALREGAAYCERRV